MIYSFVDHLTNLRCGSPESKNASGFGNEVVAVHAKLYLQGQHSCLTNLLLADKSLSE